jgi:hypothetical protein
MVDDLLESNSAGLPTDEEKEIQAHKPVQGRLDKDGTKHNKPPMAVEEYESYSIWIKTDDGESIKEKRRHYQESVE